mgnify:CR=1 FL=1
MNLGKTQFHLFMIAGAMLLLDYVFLWLGWFLISVPVGVLCWSIFDHLVDQKVSEILSGIRQNFIEAFSSYGELGDKLNELEERRKNEKESQAILEKIAKEAQSTLEDTAKEVKKASKTKKKGNKNEATTN